MPDVDIWMPAPCIKMKFSQYAPQTRDVLLTYSTDTEKVNPEKAREQASIIAEGHLGNIPIELRAGKKKKSTVRCALVNENSILVRNIGIMTPEEQGDETEMQRLTLGSGFDDELLTDQILHLPESSFHVKLDIIMLYNMVSKDSAM
ncbi:hypothetical protein LA080_013872 [Diaporthe eres]|nr:hypothetical protein LA080_013872 [Diaporthe eres]